MKAINIQNYLTPFFYILNLKTPNATDSVRVEKGKIYHQPIDLF